jgi:F0F1-type ATP synthase delta subunit
MINPLSKRYSKALIEAYSGDVEKLQASLDALLRISSAFRIDKFRDIQNLGNVDSNSKADLVRAVADYNDAYFGRFLNLLINENRLTQCESIAEEVRLFLTSKSGTFFGECYSTFAISDETRNEISKAISLRIGKTVELSGASLAPTNDFDGIRVQIKDLNVEVTLNKPAIAHEIVASVLQQIQLKSF